MCQLFVSEIVSFMFFSIINELWNSFFGICWSFQNFWMFFFLGWGEESTVVKFVTKEKILYKVIWLRNFQFHIAVVKTYYEAQAKSDCKSDSQNLLEVWKLHHMQIVEMKRLTRVKWWEIVMIRCWKYRGREGLHKLKDEHTQKNFTKISSICKQTEVSKYLKFV